MSIQLVREPITAKCTRSRSSPPLIVQSNLISRLLQTNRLIHPHRKNKFMASSTPSLNAIANQTLENSQPSLKPAIMGFYAFAVLFNLCLVAQVLTVGLAYFDNPAWWNTHVWLVRGYSGLSLVLLAWVYWLSMSQRIRMLTLSLPVLLGLQFLTIHGQLPLPISLAIFHPLLGFSLFSASTTLVHRVGHIIFLKKDDNTTL